MMDTGGSNAPAGLARFDGTRKRRHGAVVVVVVSLGGVEMAAAAAATLIGSQESRLLCAQAHQSRV